MIIEVYQLLRTYTGPFIRRYPIVMGAATVAFLGLLLIDLDRLVRGRGAFFGRGPPPKEQRHRYVLVARATMASLLAAQEVPTTSHHHHPFLSPPPPPHTRVRVHTRTHTRCLVDYPQVPYIFRALPLLVNMFVFVFRWLFVNTAREHLS